MISQKTKPADLRDQWDATRRLRILDAAVRVISDENVRKTIFLKHVIPVETANFFAAPERLLRQNRNEIQRIVNGHRSRREAVFLTFTASPWRQLEERDVIFRIQKIARIARSSR